MRLKTHLLIVLILLSSCHLASAQKLHAILVADTDSNLKQSVQSDIAHFKSVLKAGLPNNKLRIIVIKGKQVTPNNITNLLKGIVINPTDSVLFYYSGHGGFDNKKGHFFALTNSKQHLYRSQVVHAITNPFKPRFWAIITDCCASVAKAAPQCAAAGGKQNKSKKLLTHLFLKTKGSINITSSRPEQVSYGPASGGLFTTSFCNVLGSNFNKQFDWNEIFYKTRSETSSLSECGLSNEVNFYTFNGIKQKTQIPYSFQTMYGKPVNGLRLGIYTNNNSVITSVLQGSVAAMIGLKAGVKIIRVNGQLVPTNDLLVTAVNFSQKNAVIEVNDNGVLKKTKVQLAY